MQGARLSGRDLRRASLIGTLPSDADLSGARIRWAVGADMRRTKMAGADLRGACLEGAKFQDAKASAIRTNGADFSSADLATVDFLKCKYFKKAIINEDTALPEDLCGER